MSLENVDGPLCPSVFLISLMYLMHPKTWMAPNVMLSGTGRRDFVGRDGVNSERVVGHALENDGELLADGRSAKRFRLAAAPLRVAVS